MAIYRSQAVRARHIADSNTLQQALEDWRRRVREAEHAGQQQGMAEAEERVAAAERRAVEAEERAERAEEAATAAALDRFGPLLTAVEASLQQLEDLHRQIVADGEREIVRLALDIAAAILRRTVDEDPEWFAEILPAALAQVPDRRQVRLRLHPTDADLVRDRVSALHHDLPGLERLGIDDDLMLAPGSCLVACQGTQIDAGVPGSWERVVERLMDAAPHPDCQVGLRRAADPTDTNDADTTPTEGATPSQEDASQPHEPSPDGDGTEPVDGTDGEEAIDGGDEP